MTGSTPIDPNWERDAWVELAFLEMRLDSPTAAMPGILDTIGALETAPKSIDSLYVDSYYHLYGGRPAEAYTSATELVALGPSVNYKILSGAGYVSHESARILGNYDDALTHSALAARRFGCCLKAAWDSGDERCENPRGCANYATAYTNVLLERFQAEDRPAYLDTAFMLSQWALDQYELNFRNEQEESALNVMQVLGQRMLNASLEAAYEMTVRGSSANPLFQTMERGKALLLQLDLQQGLSDATNARVANEFRNLRAQMEELKNVYLREGQLPLAALERYQRVSQEFERLSAGYAPENPDIT